MTNITKIFSIYLFVIGVSAVYGGWAIVYTDVMQFPPGFLDTTPFDSFVIPGIILAFVYGGIQFLAAVLLWIKNKWMYEAAAAAGFCQLIWMVTEIYMIPDHHPIQIVYMIFAIITLIAVMLLLKYRPIKS
jgi:hypothetical protein